MPNTGDYDIYYTSACEEVKDAKISVHYIVNKNIEVTEFKIEGLTTSCNISPFSSFTITLDKATTGLLVKF